MGGVRASEKSYYDDFMRSNVRIFDLDVARRYAGWRGGLAFLVVAYGPQEHAGEQEAFSWSTWIPLRI